jgi:hypothetical protein
VNPGLLTTIELDSCLIITVANKSGLIYDEDRNRHKYDSPEISIPLSDIKARIGRFMNYRNVTWWVELFDILPVRSLEIWKLLDRNQLENSMGILSINAKQSLNGKIGGLNHKLFEFTKDKKLKYKKFYPGKYYQKYIKPLSLKAIQLAKEMAKNYSNQIESVHLTLRSHDQMPYDGMYDECIDDYLSQYNNVYSRDDIE